MGPQERPVLPKSLPKLKVLLSENLRFYTISGFFDGGNHDKILRFMLNHLLSIIKYQAFGEKIFTTIIRINRAH